MWIKLKEWLSPNHIVYGLITLLLAIILALIPVLCNKPDIYYPDSRPSLIFLDNPKIDSIRTPIDISSFPKKLIVKKVKPTSLVENNNSSIFKKDSLIKNYDTLFISSQIKTLNIDSIFSNTNNFITKEVIPFLYFKIRVKNIGKRVSKIVATGFTDTMSTLPVLRSQIYTQNHNENFIFRYIPEFEKTEILPDSTLEINFNDLAFNFITDSITNNCILHFIIIYKDSEDNYFDSYFWVKYKDLKYTNDVIIQPLYHQFNDGNLFLYKVVLHYKEGKKPLIKDYLQFIESKTEYERRLTEKEKEVFQKSEN